ncbi:MAG TPA: hypothetical protein VH593_28375 [Ktedonobacteraceae bacterium]|jgi:hypothetical protein
MVPEAFHDYFVASTGAGAALLGLLFVAISIAPEQTVKDGAPVERQAAASSAYTALLNAFLLSLVALIPQLNIGWAALVLGLIGLANHFILAWNLFRHVQRRWLSLGRRATLILAGVVLYAYELYNAVLLLRTPTNPAPISSLAPLLIGIYALGLARAWQLIGGRHYHLSDLLSSLHNARDDQPARDADQSRSTISVIKDGDKGAL